MIGVLATQASVIVDGVACHAVNGARAVAA
jgi:hypothetical protein